MLHRLLLACVGGAAITITMFLGMSEIVDLFTERDPTRYYRITDFIPGTGGRQRPELVLPQAQPRRATIDQVLSGDADVAETPNFDAGAAITAAPQPLLLEEPSPLDAE